MLKRMVVAVVATVGFLFGFAGAAVAAEYDSGSVTCELYEDAYATGTGVGTIGLRAPGASSWWYSSFNNYERSYSATVYKDGGSWSASASVSINAPRTFGSCR